MNDGFEGGAKRRHNSEFAKDVESTKKRNRGGVNVLERKIVQQPHSSENHGKRRAVREVWTG
jgi:hypothetical protein